MSGHFRERKSRRRAGVALGVPLSIDDSREEQQMRARLALPLGFALGPRSFAVIATTGCVTAGSHGGGTGGSTVRGTGRSMAT
jgi:hypothetical protein